MDECKEVCLKLRQDIFKTVVNSKAGHLASSLSSVEILVSLYRNGVLKYDVDNPEWSFRDRFILSKGHAALALYHVLADVGYYTKEQVFTFCMEGTIFGGLATYGKVPGIEMTSGSLGHGLSFAAGIAKAAKIKEEKFRVYVLLGDGELQEGEIWAAALYIAHNKLNNLTVIIDKNGIQATGFNKNIINVDKLEDKWNSFGFDTVSIDGHNVDLLTRELKIQSEKPRVIIANTVKGKGISFVENKEDWHYKMPTEKEIEKGLCELKMSREDLK